MGFVPKTFIDFEEYCAKIRCKYCKCSNQLYPCQGSVAGVIIGDRLGIVDHRNDNTQVFNFDLDKSDCYAIDAVCTNANNLFEIIGDCGDEYR